MTVQDIAQIEGISERQAQRYCHIGFRGHVLPSVMTGKARSIDPKDYRAWRIACGWDAAPAIPQVSAPKAPAVHPASAPSPEVRCTPKPVKSPPPYPPYPLPADPHGVLTNAPHEHSCNFPHPLAVADHMRQQAKALMTKYRGKPDDNED